MSSNDSIKATAKDMPLADFKFPVKKMIDNDKDDNQYGNLDEMKLYTAPSTTPPIISLQQGLQTKATPLALASWVKLALTLDGRDKITKICQYSARLLAWFYLGSYQAKRFKAVQTSLTTSRKAYRLGRSLIEIQKIRESGVLELIFGGGSSGSFQKSDPAWKIIGNAMKSAGLFGFWAGDNVSFLSGSGLFDDYREGVDEKERITSRNNLKTKSSLFATRFYFVGCVAGLVTGLRSYWTHRQTTIREAHARLVEIAKLVAQTDQTKDKTKNEELWKEATSTFEEARKKQFSLFVALLKSCMDVIVFSNNPGIDFHMKLRGKKNHEGLHCLCGLISASTVVYNSFPNASSS